MGSFIYNGFASNLPVERGDDAVMFICIENNEYRCHNDKCHIGLNGKNVLPIALPVFGKADDYGFIEEPVRDYNYEWLCKLVGGDILELLKEVEHYHGNTIEEVREDIKEKEEEKEKGKYYCKDILEQAYKYIELHDKLVGKLFGTYDAIVCALERKDVYDMFIRMDFEKPYMYGFHEKEEAKQIEPVLEHLIPIIEKISENSSTTVSPWSLDLDEYARRIEIEIEVGIYKDEEDKKKAREIIDIINKENDNDLNIAHISIMSDVKDSMLKVYNFKPVTNAYFDWKQYTKEICDFMHFNRTLADIWGSYDKSTYGGQFPNYRKIIAVNSEYAKIMRVQKKKSDDY